MASIESALGRVHSRPFGGSVAVPNLFAQVCHSASVGLGRVLDRTASHQPAYKSLKPQVRPPEDLLLVAGKLVPLDSAIRGRRVRVLNEFRVVVPIDERITPPMEFKKK